ncbi:MAG: hypothetical protein WCJ60_02025 [bacterium]
MTTIEILNSNPTDALPELVLKNNLYPSFEVTGRRGIYSVEFVDYEHPDVKAAKQIELLAFQELGDNPAEVTEEFERYDESSVFVLLRRSKADLQIAEGHTQIPGRDLLGMARFIPFHTQGNKTFNDLAILMDASTSKGSERSSRSTPELGISDRLEEIISLFKQQYACDDVEKVIDIATLAPDMTLDFRDKMDVIESLLKAMDVFVIDLFKRKQLTHLTQFTFSAMHDILANKYGYPMHNLFSMQPIVYDTFGNGKGAEENMVAVPSVINLSELERVFSDSVDHPATKHMGAVVTQLMINFHSI